MTKPSKNYKEFLHQRLQDPEEAALYINAMLEDEEDKDGALLMLALRDVAEAYGVARVAAKSKLNRESLYKLLSKRGNPRLSSLNALLKAVGLRLVIEVDEAKVEVANNGVVYQGGIRIKGGSGSGDIVDFQSFAQARRSQITSRLTQTIEIEAKEDGYALDAIAA